MSLITSLLMLLMLFIVQSALGFHAYLQRNGIAFEGVMAKVANNKMFKHIRSKLDEANLELGGERGSPGDCAGTGLRFAHVMAVAPNASSSILMGNTSPSIEPYRANAYRQDTLSGSHLNKNKFLDAILRAKGLTEEQMQDTWSSIIANEGLKTLYYCRSEKLAKADKVSKRIEREVIKELDMTAIAQGNECLACEG
jgi:ribonucleotide reductase alpha subunit